MEPPDQGAWRLKLSSCQGPCWRRHLCHTGSCWGSAPAHTSHKAARRTGSPNLLGQQRHAAFMPVLDIDGQQRDKPDCQPQQQHPWVVQVCQGVQVGQVVPCVGCHEVVRRAANQRACMGSSRDSSRSTVSHRLREGDGTLQQFQTRWVCGKHVTTAAMRRAGSAAAGRDEQPPECLQAYVPPMEHAAVPSNLPRLGRQPHPRLHMFSSPHTHPGRTPRGAPPRWGWPR